ncbi:MAG: 2-oxo-4-hydroxy-4-carboxy-5-ureidoimidazoline decarboxylase [Planctomycetota bacterium]
MNPTTIDWLNALPADQANEQLRRVCGAEWWTEQMTQQRPFTDASALTAAADAAFDRMPREAWLEAFACHPRIGDINSLRMKFAGNKDWSAGEQSGAASADEQTLVRLAAGNDAYFERFGYTFIVCATGKSAAEMLAILEARLANDDESELPVAAAEQRKITHLRLEKLNTESK